METPIKEPRLTHERYDYLMNHFAGLNDKKENIHKITDAVVLKAFYHDGKVKLIISGDAQDYCKDTFSTITTKTIWVDYYNIIELLSFNVFTMNYLEYIGANREKAINTLLNSCTVDIVQEFENPDFKQWNAYRFEHYTPRHSGFFNHVTKIQLSNKSIGIFNDMMKLDKLSRF